MVNWKDKNVLITGVTGFVGSYLADKLIKQKANVFGLVRCRADGLNAKNLVDHRIINDLKSLEGDLTDITSVANALDKSDPDYIFHLAAQSFVPRSFQNPMETQTINCVGTANLLDAVRIKNCNPRIIFAGSSEEYGLVISSFEQFKHLKEHYGAIFPEPNTIPEIPIKETNPLRPMSPYAVSKVHGDYLMRNYHHSYGLNTVVSRAFNHEGAGRGVMFLTSVVTNQVMKLKFGEVNKIKIGNVNAFRDWSHVKDIINGYMLLAEKGKSGTVYNQGSMRTNSILTYILLSLEHAGWNINKIETFKNEKTIKNPTEPDESKIFGIKFNKTKIDQMMLEEELNYSLEDKGIYVYTDQKRIPIKFYSDRFRLVEVPILLSDTEKIQRIGGKISHKLNSIIEDQLNYFIKKENRD